MTVPSIPILPGKIHRRTGTEIPYYPARRIKTTGRAVLYRTDTPVDFVSLQIWRTLDCTVSASWLSLSAPNSYCWDPISPGYRFRRNRARIESDKFDVEFSDAPEPKSLADSLILFTRDLFGHGLVLVLILSLLSLFSVPHMSLSWAIIFMDGEWIVCRSDIFISYSWYKYYPNPQLSSLRYSIINFLFKYQSQSLVYTLITRGMIQSRCGP